MKWYMALNEAGTGGDLAMHARVAVLSARANTTLQPHLLYYGERNDFTRWLERNGVRIINSQPHFLDLILDLVSEGRYSEAFIGHWLRVSVCVEEWDDPFLLYTDIDVLIRRDPDLRSIRPEVLAAAPEFQPTNWNYFNAGVMVVNVERLRADHARFERYLREHLAARTYGFHNQIAYNDFYRRRWSRLPVEMNWKPYWGWNPAAEIVHFHGPKLGAIGAILDGSWDWSSDHGSQIGSLFASHVADYEAYLRLCLDAAPGLPAEDEDRIAQTLRRFPAYRDRAAGEPIDLSFTTQSMFPDDDAPPAIP